MLEDLSPNAKKLLMVGVPIVAVIAFVMIVKKPSGGSTTTATPATTPAPYPGSALDTGQLAAYESTVTGQLGALQQTLDGTSSTPMAIPSQGLVGSGYGPFSSLGAESNYQGTTEQVATQSGTYSWVSPDQFGGLASSGTAFYYQPFPGQFQVVTPSTVLAPGTALYAKTG